jgi:hypothetical protein
VEASTLLKQHRLFFGSAAQRQGPHPLLEKMRHYSIPAAFRVNAQHAVQAGLGEPHVFEVDALKPKAWIFDMKLRGSKLPAAACVE